MDPRENQKGLRECKQELGFKRVYKKAKRVSYSSTVLKKNNAQNRAQVHDHRTKKKEHPKSLLDAGTVCKHVCEASPNESNPHAKSRGRFSDTLALLRRQEEYAIETRGG